MDVFEDPVSPGSPLTLREEGPPWLEEGRSEHSTRSPVPVCFPSQPCAYGQGVRGMRVEAHFSRVKNKLHELFLQFFSASQGCFATSL